MREINAAIVEARRKLVAMGARPISRKDGLDVWKDNDGQAFVYNRDGEIFKFDEETEMAMSLKEMAELYNSKVPAEKQVKRFSDRKAAEKQVKEVGAMEGKKRGRTAKDGKVTFQAPEGKIWHKESARFKVYDLLKGRTMVLSNAIAKASEELKLDEKLVRGCINILIKDGNAQLVAE